MIPHAPKSLDEHIVAYIEVKEGCAKVGVIPPPSKCSDVVQNLASFASWYPFTILICTLFLGMLASFTWKAIFGDGEHH